MESLENLSVVWSSWVLAASWQLGLLVILITLLAFLAQRLSPRWRYTLWLLVIVKVFLPPSLALVWGIGNWGIWPVWNQAQTVIPDFSRSVKSPAVQDLRPSVDETISPQLAAITKETIVSPKTTSVPNQSTSRDFVVSKPHQSWTLTQILFSGWLLGFICFLSFVLLRYMRLSLSLKSARVIDEGPLRVELERLALQLGKEDPPDLLISEHVSSPFLYGLFRPRIVLPANLPAALSPDELKHILLHELVHWKRRDVVVGWVQLIAQALFWFHPFVWLANTRVRHERECACDEAAIRQEQCAPKGYGEALLKVLLAAEGHSSASLGLPGIFERNTKLQKRLEEIMNSKTRTHRFGAWGWAFIALFALVFLPMSSIRTTAEGNNSAPAPYESEASERQADVLWNKVLEVNRIWLDPHPPNLRYTLYMGDPAKGEGKKYVNHVWVKGEMVRWEMSADGKKEYVVIRSPEKEVYIDPQKPGSLDFHSPGDTRYFSQGTTWYTGIHELIRNGLPANARIAERQKTAAGEVVVLEANVGESRGEVGLGIRHYWTGRSSFRLNHIRLHIRLPDYVPVLEEDFDKDGKKVAEIEFGPRFTRFGTQQAPEKLRFSLPGEMFPGLKWALEAHFEKVDGIWLLKEGLNLQNGKVKGRIFTSDVSTRPIDPEVFDVSIVAAETASKVPEFRGNAERATETPVQEIPHKANLREGIPANAVPLGYVDDTAEDKQSLGASGHAVKFQRRGNARFVKVVQIFASRYGYPQAPKEDFHLYLLNEKMQVLADLRYPYGMIERGEMKWYTLRTPSIEVPEQFTVAFSFNPSRTKGVYLGIDKSVSKSRSLMGLPDSGFEEVKQPEDWMVRVYLSEQPSGVKGVKRLAEWKAPVKVEPFEGCGEVKYDNGKSDDMQSYGERCPTMRILPADSGLGAETLALKGFRLYASRYGSGYIPGKTFLYAYIIDSRDKILQKAVFPYAKFSYKPKWVNLVLEEPVAIEKPAEYLTIAFDPEAHRTKGIYFHYNKNPQVSHSLVGTAGKGFTALPDREWMIRTYFQAGKEISGSYGVRATPATKSLPSGPPRIVATSPVVGATDVDPSISEITVTFDRDMSGGMSWTGGGPQFPPNPEHKRPFWRDKRTCVLPVKLAPGHYHRVGINSTSYQNFRSVEGVPARPSAIYFTTRGASEELKRKAQKPVVVKMEPPNGATNVDPNLTEIRVTFNLPMGKGFSWTGGGPHFPTIPEGKRPYWTNDRKTCVLPVQLRPRWQYRLGLNSPSHKNFQSQGGVPLNPVAYTFTTGE